MRDVRTGHPATRIVSSLVMSSLVVSSLAYHHSMTRFGERTMSATMVPMILVLCFCFCFCFCFFFFAIVAYGQTGAAPSEYRPKGSTREYFLGAWKLVSTEYEYADWHTTPYPELGRDAAGFLMYTPSGPMCAQLMKPGRRLWSERDTPTAVEAASALDGFISYWGTFQINENERIMIHRPVTAASPNYSGTTLDRPYHLANEDRFFFRGAGTEKQKDGTEGPVIWTITWKRLK